MLIILRTNEKKKIRLEKLHALKKQLITHRLSRSRFQLARPINPHTIFTILITERCDRERHLVLDRSNQHPLALVFPRYTIPVPVPVLVQL